MRADQELIQPGYKILIRREPVRAKRFGFMLNTEHTIVEPPKGKVNSLMGVWVIDNFNRKRIITFPYWIATGERVKTKMKRRRTISRNNP